MKKNKDFDDFEIDNDEPVYTTGVLCKLLDIPVWVLKQLDNEGIVSPSRKETGAARLYSKKEVTKLAHCWQYMSKKGVKVKGLKVILEIEERYEKG